ncbi:alpha/beta fold hydrolase [Streptomyces sp. NPDC008086]|uniref:alpha/beta fold hydrolase n=1 Tax=Streptomyces sp. NPDC008086 TaxID=3364807 RepID=UPI0036F08EC0
MDCRGYGEAMDTPGTYTMEEVAADALAVADDLGWNTFSVIGHSMGGKAAQLMLLDAPLTGPLDRWHLAGTRVRVPARRGDVGAVRRGRGGFRQPQDDL